MKRKQFFLRVAGIFLAVAALIAIGVWRISPKTSAQNTALADAASTVAVNFGEEDLVYTGIDERDFGLDDVGLESQYAYHSEQTGRDYYFTEDGSLAEIDGCISDEAFDNADKLPALEESVLEEMMHSFAASCLAPNQIGELICTSSNSFAGIHDYEFREVYNGAQTGARVVIECLQDGTVVFSFIIPGNCFEKLDDGTIQELRAVEITPEQAYEIAVDAVEEQLQGEAKAHIVEKEPVYPIEAFKDERYYNVELETTCPLHDDCFVTYWVHVDVADGTVLEIEHTV